MWLVGNCLPQGYLAGITTLELSRGSMQWQGFRGTDSVMSAPEHTLQCTFVHPDFGDGNERLIVDIEIASLGRMCRGWDTLHYFLRSHI